MKKYFLVALAVFVSGAFVATSVFKQKSSTAQAQSAPMCPTNITTNITQGATLTGIAPVNIGFPTSLSSFTINKVVLKLDSTLTLGQARSLSGSNAWTMAWATPLTPAGVHNLHALITFNQTSVCQTLPVSVTILPTSSVVPQFDVLVAPNQWSGPTNTSVDFLATPNTNLPIPPNELMQYIAYEWDTNVGTIATTQGGARLNSGGSAGVGRLRLKAMYSGREVLRELPLQVQSQNVPVGTTTTTTTGSGTNNPPTTTTTSGTSPTTSTTTTASTSPTVPLTPAQKVELIASQLSAQPEILSCANINLTPARIEALRTSGRRLDQLEFEKIKGCFAQLNYVVPVSYAPVAAEDVKTDTVKVSNDARINNAQTSVPKTDKPKALRFQGQSEPNKDVLLYVFSEPLVLYAKADGDGNWVYDLVDPLQPGKHEAYALVETADGTYKKSNPFSFLIQTAQASADNPNGYSLSVETVASLNPPASKQRINLYMIVSGIIVLIVLTTGGVILTKTLKHIPSSDDTPDGQDT